MNCMKCGRETRGEDVFCQDCLTEMKKYPVDPGTVVLLPKREENHFIKKPQPKRRAAPTPEEQIKSLKIRLRIVTVMLLISLTLMAVLVYPVARELLDDPRFRPGQNYNTVTVTEATEATLDQ